MQQLYTQAHVTQVFILGLLNGCLMAAVVMMAVNGIKRLRRRASVIPLKCKIPTSGTSEYRVIGQNY